MSEELAGQSEQMQATIEYFRIPDSHQNRVEQRKKTASPQKKQPISEHPKNQPPETGRIAAKKTAQKEQKGIVLALDEERHSHFDHGDEHDKEFQEF